MKKLKQAAALKYEPQDNAPRVVAIGKGEIAERIIKISKENNIPFIQDEETAQILCSLPINSEIPEELYTVIAEIYAFILNMDLKNKQE